ncbi:MAG: hypothetical protein ACJZ9F_02190 [Rhodospirillaceae bacterium]
MTKHIQTLGWVVRRTKDPMPPGIFYRDILGLPELRRRDNDRARNIMLWAGHFSALETIWLGKPHPPVSRIEDAEVIPIFRVRNLGAVRARLERFKVNFIPPSDPNDETLYFTDPDGFVSGIREPEAGSDLTPDIEANRIWREGIISLPDTPNMPSDIQDIGWLRIHVQDPHALAPFYSGVVGLDLLEDNNSCGVSLHIGETTSLELCPGGSRRSTPKDRKDLPDVWILRGYDFKVFTENMAEANVPLVNELILGAGSLNYYADPEGHVFGFQERRAYDPEDPLTHRIEDRVARAAWNESQD